jgi:hypothetical protein
MSTQYAKMHEFTELIEMNVFIEMKALLCGFHMTGNTDMHMFFHRYLQKR